MVESTAVLSAAGRAVQMVGQWADCWAVMTVVQKVADLVETKANWMADWKAVSTAAQTAERLAVTSAAWMAATKESNWVAMMAGRTVDCSAGSSGYWWDGLLASQWAVKMGSSLAVRKADKTVAQMGDCLVATKAAR